MSVYTTGPTRIIKPQTGWRPIEFRELWEYRDLLYFLVWRDLKVRYAQSVLGISWAIIQPVFFMIVFTVVFGNLANISSDGVPYAIFSFTALVPWTYFSTSFTEATGSLVQNQNMLNKVYFPRLIMPFAPILSKLVDFMIAFILLLIMMVWFKTSPTLGVLLLPALVLLMMTSAVGIGMLLTSLAVQYRDIKYGITFLAHLLMYAAPVVYPASLVPDKYRLIYGLNPMAGVVEGFRSALLGTNSMPWDLMIVGTITSIILVTIGALYFRRTERIFADVA